MLRAVEAPTATFARLLPPRNRVQPQQKPQKAGFRTCSCIKRASAAVKPVRHCKHPKNRLESAVRLASREAHGRLLEIGAGDGSCALTLLNHYEELVLTELSLPRVGALRRLFEGNDKVRVLHHDVEGVELPFPADYFDTVLMIAVIEHMVDPNSVLKNLRRMLRPGGRLILDTPNIAKWTRRAKLAAGYFPSTASLDEGLLCYDRKSPTDLHDEGHLHYFTFRSLRRLCVEKAGFRSVEAHGYGGLLCRAWPTMFSEVAMVTYK